jgi:LysR family transcriptional regulator, regulator of the ytmI operon
MEFRHLQTFQSIARAGSFIKAAEQLQYAQSTITLHIQQLEAELGVKLFARQGKRTELTIAGRTLLEHADLLLHRAANLQQTMTDLVAGEAGHLRIGSIEPIASTYLPTLLVRFCQEHPQVRLTLEVGVTRSISQQVAAGALDLAICSPPSANLNLSFELLFHDAIELLIPDPHPLATVAEIFPSSLIGERPILTEEHCPYRHLFEQALLTRGINPFAGIEVMSLAALKQMVRYGLGIGVIPTSAIASSVPNTVTRSISGLDLNLPVGIVVRSEACFPGSALNKLMTVLNDGLTNSSAKNVTSENCNDR